MWQAARKKSSRQDNRVGYLAELGFSDLSQTYHQPYLTSSRFLYKAQVSSLSTPTAPPKAKSLTTPAELSKMKNDDLMFAMDEDLDLSAEACDVANDENVELKYSEGAGWKGASIRDSDECLVAVQPGCSFVDDSPPSNPLKDNFVPPHLLVPEENSFLRAEHRNRMQRAQTIG